MRGLGDLVAKGTFALGIKQKPGCGCAKRQALLNKWVPFGDNPKAPDLWIPQQASPMQIQYVGVSGVGSFGAPIVQAGHLVPLCGLSNDTSQHLPANWNTFAAPAQGGNYTDAIFGCTVTRITDAANNPQSGHSGKGISNYYATIFAMNSDDTMIWVQTSDGFNYIEKNYANPAASGLSSPVVPLANLPQQGLGTGNNTRYNWSRTDPKTIYWTNNNSLQKGVINTSTGIVTTTTVHTFAEYAGGGINMMDEASISFDGDKILLVGQGTSGGTIDIFTWSLSGASKSTPYTTTCTGTIGAPNQNGCLHKLQIFADNQLMIQFVNDGTGTENGVRKWDGSSLVHIQNSTNHIDAGQDRNGNPVYVCDANQNGVFTSSLPCTDSLSTNALTTVLESSPTGTGAKCLFDNISAYHVGYQGGPNQPWVCVSMFDPCPPSTPRPEYYSTSANFTAITSGNWAAYEDEIVIARIDAASDPTKVYRLAHQRTRSCEGSGIQSQGLATISMSGKYVTFTSTMAHPTGCPGGFSSGDCQDVYVVGPLF